MACGDRVFDEPDDEDPDDVWGDVSDDGVGSMLGSDTYRSIIGFDASALLV